MADALRDGYLAHLQEQQVATREIQETLREAAREARRIVLSQIPDGATISELERRGRAGSAFQALEEIDDGLWDSVSQTTRRRMRSAGQASADAFGAMTETLVQGVDPDVLPADFERGLRAAAIQRVQNIAENYAAEVPLSDRVYRNSQWTKAKVRQQVRNGLSRGTSARNLASEVQRFISPDTPGGARYAARRLARTEINNTFHAASTRGAANSPWVEAMRWHLSASHPRPDPCDTVAEDSSGNNFRAGEYLPADVPSKPHPNCLCYTTEVTVNDQEFSRALRAGEYNEWLGAEGLETF